MKSVITEAPKTPEYPCLMIHGTDLVVLFTDRSTGTVVSKTDLWPVGRYSATWWEESFIPFAGTITLEN